MTPNIGSEKKAVSARQLLTRALRANGYRKICKEEEPDYSLGGKAISINFLLSTMAGLIIYATNGLGWSIWVSLTSIFVSLVGFAALIAYAGFPSLWVYLVYVLLWLVAGLEQLVAGDVGDLVLSHIMPFGIVLGFRSAAGALQLTTHVPFFVPLALLIVLLPLLTEDPWLLASTAGSRLGLLAAISVLPLAALFVIRLVRLDIGSVLVGAAARVSDKPDVEHMIFRTLKRVHDKDREVELDQEPMTALLRSSYQTANVEAQIAVAAHAARRTFRWRSFRTFLSLFFGISLALWVLIYGLAWAAVPPPLATDWSKHQVLFESLNLLGWNISLPLGPYIMVAFLLTAVACVGFLGFALTEDQYSAALWDAIVNKPAEEYLVLALPYLAMTHGLQMTPRKTPAAKG